MCFPRTSKSHSKIFFNGPEWQAGVVVVSGDKTLSGNNEISGFPVADCSQKLSYNNIFYLLLKCRG